MDRRTFILSAAGTLLKLTAGNLGKAEAKQREQKMKAKVSLVKGMDRAQAIEMVVDMLGFNPVIGKNVLLKPNFNTADPFPASTHNETLVQLIRKLKSMGATSLTIG